MGLFPRHYYHVNSASDSDAHQTASITNNIYAQPSRCNPLVIDRANTYAMASITILYPSGHEFDMEYYMQTHMPLVTNSWKGEGLKSWEIIQFAPGQPYQIQACLKFESLAAFEAACTGKNSEVVFGDIARFTAAKPVVLKGTQQGSGTVA